MSLKISKSVSDSLLEKPSMTSMLMGVSNSQIIGEFFVLSSSVSVESSLNGVVLIRIFFFLFAAVTS